VLGVASDHPFHSWGRKPFVSGTAEDIARGLKPSAWRRLSTGNGTKGPRLSEWAYLELADLAAGECGATDDDSLWTRGLLIRRSLDDGAMAYFSTWCPAGTTMETLVALEGHRWAVEEGFEVAKSELGLDHNETRSWHGWHRHVLLVMLGLAMLATIRHRANRGRQKISRQSYATKSNTLIPWSVQEVRRIAVRLAQRRIEPAHIIAWSLWRRAHQAAAQRAHMKQRMHL
jgi:SRSO17 transposase